MKQMFARRWILIQSMYKERSVLAMISSAKDELIISGGVSN